MQSANEYFQSPDVKDNIEIIEESRDFEHMTNIKQEESISSDITEEDNQKLVERLISSIPEIGQDFDVPEYVTINNISYQDLTFLYRTCSKKNASRKKIVYNRNIPKRIKLMPKHNVNKHQFTTKFSTNRKAVHVPFTIIPNNGDHINDHDYLPNPYKGSIILSQVCHSIDKSEGQIQDMTDASTKPELEDADSKERHGFKQAKINVCNINNGIMKPGKNAASGATLAEDIPNNMKTIEDDVASYETVPIRSFSGSSEQFKLHFRMNRSTFHFLMRKLYGIASKQAKYSYDVLEKELLICLWYMGTTEGLKSVVTRFNTIPFTWKNLFLMGYLIDDVNDQNGIISWPSEEQANNIMKEFEKISGVPGVIGCVKGYHIKTPLCRNTKVYSYTKLYNSIYLQGVCDNRKSFTDVYLHQQNQKYLHTAALFRKSDLGCKDPKYSFPKGSYIVGDKDFKLEEYVMVDYTENLDDQKRAFNGRLSQTRAIADEAFAMMRGRFIRLKFMDTRKVDVILAVTKMACILHNICILQNDGNPDDILNIEKEIQELHRDSIDSGSRGRSAVSIEAEHKRRTLMENLLS
ncbi:hypothetical protein GWI33_020474 [Rhynchophorus ferrugineus]|uniref:DDE Tnp4 domain-containing protein n=1 Tax=Rhynchophorus ferrugineus TaxID=354439 RepID=A0A834HRJ6_RHYFE|nr:hypothetical protein GWI33_020474 [Rhynchophorus ferrugineus]